MLRRARRHRRPLLDGSARPQRDLVDSVGPLASRSQRQTMTPSWARHDRPRAGPQRRGVDDG